LKARRSKFEAITVQPIERKVRLCREAIKVFVFFPLVIIRSVLIVFTIVVFVFPVALIASAGADLSKPFAHWRRQTLLWIRPPLKLLLFFMGVSVNVTGWENYQDALKNDLVRSLWKACNTFRPD
jgi:hypothetical protein